MKLDEFTLAYVECALWSSIDDQGTPLDENYTRASIDSASMAEMMADCAAFQEEHWEDIQADLARAGQDFWLTRNRHGAGFWDGDWPLEVGERLTQAAHAYGSCDLYVVLPEDGAPLLSFLTVI